MNRKDFDSLLQNKLNNFSTPYSENVWQNLEKELDREKDKVGALWFFRNNLSAFLLVFAISCIAAFGYYQYNYTGINLPANLESKTIKDIPGTINSNNQTEKHNIEDQSTKEVSSPISLLTKPDNNITVQNTNKFGSSTFKSTKKSIAGSSLSLNNSLDRFSGFNQVEPSDEVIASTELKTNNQSVNNTNQKGLSDYSLLNTISSQKIMSIKSAKRHTKLMDNMFSNPKRNCPSFNTNVPDYYLEIFASPDYTFRTIEAKDGEYNNYKNERLNSETELLSSTLGIRGEIAFRNGLSFKTGLSYSNIREKFEHTFIGEQIPIQIIIADTFHYPGGVGFTFDTLNYVEIRNRTLVAENTIKTFEIPFIIAYQLDFTRWTMQLNGGIALQISNIQKGYVLLPNLEPLPYKSSDLDHYNLYKRQWGISFYTGLQLGYKINGQLQVFAEPYAKYYPTSITVDGYPLTQKMLTVGSNFGLKYRL